MELSHEAPLEVIQRRQRDGFIVGQDTDGCSVYLAADGGGMATATVAGELEVLSEQGYLKYFDGFGAISGATGALACALADENDLARHVYTKEIPGSEFVSVKRFVRGGPLADLGVIGTIIESTGIKPEDLPNTPFFIGLTEISSSKLNPTTGLAQKTGDKFVDTLLRSMHMPWFCGPPVGDVIDGGVGWLSTSRMTAEASARFGKPATHVVGIAATPYPECIPNDRMGGFTRRYMARHFGQLVAKSMEDFPFIQARHLNEEINNGFMVIDGRVVAAQMIRPVSISNFAGVLTTEPRRLIDTYEAGRQGAINALSGAEQVHRRQVRRPIAELAIRLVESAGLGILPNVIGGVSGINQFVASRR